jgi:hypothetical protein
MDDCQTPMVMASNGEGLSPPSTPFGTPPWERRARLRYLALRAFLVTTVAGLAFAGSAAAAPAPRLLDHPSLAAITDGPAFIPDATLQTALSPSNFWGGTYTTSTNERVTIFASRSYPVDDSANQRWAEFFATLVHGSELPQVTVYLAPPAQVSAICGGGADVLGCYGNNSIIAPGEDAPGVTAESVITHEYGHHVASHRSNAPWPAVAWGTKRWSSYLDVCARARKHELFPGAEIPLEYQFNPGEVFAEDYRVLNEQRLGLPVAPWQVVDSSLQPDAQALTLLQQDVLDPWTTNRATQISGRFTARGSSVRTYRVADTLDGSFSAAASGNPRVRVQILSGSKVVARGGSSVTTTICGGSRSFSVRVTRLVGSGAFTLSFSRP